MSISVLFVLSLRGDTIIYRDFRRDIKRGINEVFFRKVNFFDSDETAPPVFNEDGVNFIYIKRNELYLVIATLDNASPNYFLEILERLMKVISDQCGVLSEESIRKNFVLIYEIIDEMLDFGFPQLSSTEQIKPFVFTEPVVMMKTSLSNMLRTTTASGENIKRPISQNDDGKNKKNEIYVDIIEKITVLFNSSGKLINSDLDGCIKMKSYLKNSPELTIVLNDEVDIGKGMYSSGRTNIEDCNFYQTVQTRELETKRTLHLIPPEGEFILMNYRISAEFSPPFKIYSYIEEADYKLSLKLKLQANFSDSFAGGNIILKFNVPKSAQSVYLELPPKNKLTQKVDYIQTEHIVIWKVPKLQGGAEVSLDTKITLGNNNPRECRKELGPVTMSFDLPNFNISKLQIKELRVNTVDKKYNAKRWVRIITQSNSYVARIG